MSPRLLTEKQAREYLGDVDPNKVMSPIRIGARVRWDKVALDQHLDTITKPKRRDEPDSPLKRWEASHAQD